MTQDKIIIQGMRENNLKDIDLSLDKNQLIVFNGLSGSGKSSIVFDTLATEALRQMTTNYSAYLRRHMTLYERPNATLMKNLSPVIVVQQKSIPSNSQSTVGTYMDVGPLIRLLFSRIGEPFIGEATAFSTTSSIGQCPDCSGNGRRIQVDLDKLVDFDKSLKDYAVQFKPLSPAGWQGRWMITGGIFDPDRPLKDWPQDMLDLFLYGPEDGGTIMMPFHTKNGPHNSQWDGLIPRFERLYVDRDISNLKEVDEEDVLAVSTYERCETCQGSGLNPRILKSKVAGYNIAEMMAMELPDLVDVLEEVQDPLGQSITQQAIPILERMIDLGLDYLSLNRPVKTLSGGESQRLKIVRQLGSSLNNMTYIFDEPSAGMHPSEIEKLIAMLKRLRDQFNTVIVVEHQPMIIEAADCLVEVGPGAGEAGGEIVFQGPPHDLSQATPTGQALACPLTVKEEPRKAQGTYELNHAKANNLKDVSIKIPKGVLLAVAGVSGSGKSSLILDEFYPRYADQAIMVDQKSIGRSSRSNLATYMGIMDDVRQALAKANGQEPGLFSFNSTGACPKCDGKGVLKPDTAFSDPVTIVCDECHGTRYSEEARSYRYRGKNIVEVLELTINQAVDYFENNRIQNKVQTLFDVGLDYLTLGQATNTLSGGELQRLKLASQLQHQNKIYLLDEPSIGLHPEDGRQLMHLFNRLVDQGNTLVMIEHNLEWLSQADWVIELGPGGGQEGGQVVFEGYPKDLVEAETATGRALRQRMNSKNT